MLTVRVIKSRWLRGKRGCSSLLMGNKMCCIGFVARQLGATPKEIRNYSTLEKTCHTACLTFASEYDPELRTAYAINDNSDIKEKDRMTQLRQLGKEMGVKFVFVDK